MAVTPILQIEQVSPSQAAKEATINSGTIALEQAGNRRLQVNLSAGDAALSVSQFTRNAVFEFVGHAVDRIVTLPGSAADRLCMVLNSGDGIVTISLGASSVVLPPDAAGFISLGMGAIKLVLTGGIDSGGDIDPPAGPIDLGLGVNLSASDATISEVDYQTYRLFIAVGNAVARTLNLPGSVENFVAIRNEGSAILTVAANGATIAIAAGETVPVVTTLTGIVKMAPEPPDYGLALNAATGNVSVNADNLLAHDVFIVSGHSVLRSLTIANGVEKSFVVYNAGSATLNVVAYSTTIAIPAGESRALYTTLSEFKAVTDQVSGGGGGYSAGLFSAVKRVDMSPGTTTVNSTDFDAFNVFIVTAANATASLRRLYFPNSVSKAFMVANASNYDIQVYFDDGNDAPVTISPGYMELLVQNNVTSTYQAFASAKRKPARHILRFEHKGLIGGDTEMGRFVAHTAMTVKGSDVGAAYLNLGVVSSDTFTVSILLNGASVGSVVFASGVASRTTSTLDFTMAAGDVLTFKSQATADATAAAMSITFPVREVVAV